jgi:hypothetical protein
MATKARINDPEVRKAIQEKTGCENPVGDGLYCPHCGAYEVYKNPEKPNDTDSWYWMIRAYRVDNSSECKSCGKWF